MALVAHLSCELGGIPSVILIMVHVRSINLATGYRALTSRALAPPRILLEIYSLALKANPARIVLRRSKNSHIASMTIDVVAAKMPELINPEFSLTIFLL